MQNDIPWLSQCVGVIRVTIRQYTLPLHLGKVVICICLWVVYLFVKADTTFAVFFFLTASFSCVRACMYMRVREWMTMCARAWACLCVGVWRSEAGGRVEKVKKEGLRHNHREGEEKLYSEELVERKEALWNRRSLGLANGYAGGRGILAMLASLSGID